MEKKEIEKVYFKKINQLKVALTQN